MTTVTCPECGESVDEKEIQWVTNAEGGVMYRLPCEHMVVGTFKDGATTYGPEHVGLDFSRPKHHHQHYHLTDELQKILGREPHEE
nr:hypothetical protein [Mycolicibacterium komanii]CRL69971.1 hypothetical protein CPGR_01773 [Mycolicibacterium komanii]